MKFSRVIIAGVLFMDIGLWGQDNSQAAPAKVQDVEKASKPPAKSPLGDSVKLEIAIIQRDIHQREVIGRDLQKQAEVNQSQYEKLLADFSAKKKEAALMCKKEGLEFNEQSIACEGKLPEDPAKK